MLAADATAAKCEAAAALPHSWGRDDANEEDPTPAERVARGENKNVLEEERVQLGQLKQQGHVKTVQKMPFPR